MRQYDGDDTESIDGSSEDSAPTGNADEGKPELPATKPPGVSRHWAAFRLIIAVLGVMVMLLGCWAVAGGIGSVVDIGKFFGEGTEKAYASLQSNYGFFAGIYSAVGLAFVVVALSFRSTRIVVLWLCGIVLLGGVARLVSLALWGAPSLIFLLMIILELAVPVAVSVWYVWIRKIESGAASYEVADK